MAKHRLTGAPLAVAGVFALAALLLAGTRVGLLDHLATYDELYHALAAQGWNATGAPAILDGEYTRTLFYTIANAWVFDLTGSTELRYPRLFLTVLPAILMGAAIAAWLFHAAGWRVAAVALAFLVVWPIGIEAAQFNRFYALHGLLSWLMVILVWLAAGARRQIAPAPLAGYLAAALCALAALYLQASTLLAIAGLGTWLALYHVLPAALRNRALLIGVLGALVVLAGVGFVLRDSVIYYASLMVWDPTGYSLDPTYYSRRIRADYPIFWGISGVFLLFSLLKLPRLTLLALCLFAVQFAVFSLASHKGDRFLFNLMPAVFVIWAGGLVACWDILSDGFKTWRVEQNVSAPSRLFRFLTGPVIVAVTLVFACATTPAFTRSVGLITGSGGGQDMLRSPRLDWRAAPGAAADVLAGNGVIVTRKELHAVQVFGDFDFGFNRSRLAELETGSTPFSRDFRTGRPMIDDIGSLEQILSCYPDGLFITSARWWRTTPLTRDIEAMARRHAEKVDVRSAGDFSMLVWLGSHLNGSDKTCATLYALRPLH